ncbi:hypothetical protein, partial [Kribbella sp. NPDC055071]
MGSLLVREGRTHKTKGYPALVSDVWDVWVELCGLIGRRCAAVGFVAAFGGGAGGGLAAGVVLREAAVVARSPGCVMVLVAVVCVKGAFGVAARSSTL